MFEMAADVEVRSFDVPCELLEERQAVGVPKYFLFDCAAAAPVLMAAVGGENKVKLWTKKDICLPHRKKQIIERQVKANKILISS